MLFKSGLTAQHIKMYPRDWEFYSVLGVPMAGTQGRLLLSELVAYDPSNVSNFVYFQKQVLRCVAAWMDWAVYTPDFLYDLQNIFLGQGEKSNQSEVIQMNI